MKTVVAEAPALPSTRPADYAELIRPRIAVMVLITVAAGALLAGGVTAPLLALHAVLGTALVACGASAVNQWLERDTDALMPRTANRPLPAGRMTAGEVLAFGLTLAVVGLAYLLLAVPSPLAAILAGVSFFGYVGLYTPLKTRTVLNTWVGAVPGALPPVIGYAAVRSDAPAEAWALFAVLFAWQIPHFLAIAWLYRDQYAAAGLKMLPGADATGRLTAWNMVGWCLLLVAAGVWPFALGLTGWLYLAGAILLGWLFLRATLAFAREHDRATARRVLLASLVYLPSLLLVWVADRCLSWVVS